MKIIRKYSCLACGGPVSKPPCVAPGNKGKDAKITYHGLGGWQCDNCGPCKIKLELIKE